MNNPAIPKIIRMLTDTAKTPGMYAYSVEPMLMRVSTLLEVSGVQFSCTDFYCKHGGKYGNTYLMELPEGMSFDEWTRRMVDDAIKMIEAGIFKDNNETPKTV